MSEFLSLTEEQQAVVHHEKGPALVFAVAGAGKTTAMVHRMARLVSDGKVQPQHILATSFGRANVQDLRLALRPFPNTGRIDVRTLHSLGRDIIKQAQLFGVGRNLRLNDTEQGQISPNQRLLTSTLIEARKQNVAYKAELDGLDRQDFLDYVDQCKGNLQYANLAQAKLPEPARKLATQAQDPSPQLTWYLDLYRLYEQLRIQQGIITFSDMLLTGWEILIRYPEVLTAVQSRYRHILVDEFQDVNLAQSEMLDLLALPHQNYMAIGDDDQTIYEWRGASPRYILDFSKRYRAKTYLMRDNFRCPAVPLVLANQVIAHNKQRYEKQLQLTQGFRGETAVATHRDIFEMSHNIVRQVQQLQKTGTTLREIAVLVRLNAQTPPIEQALILANLPYRVSQPFYERIEIKTLIQYGRLAWFEQQVRAGKRPLTSPASRDLFSEAWRDISNRPKRYMSGEVRRRIWEQAVRQERPLSQIIQNFAEHVKYGWQQEPLEKLADDLAWLATQLEKPAQKVLHQLDIRLDYQTWLKSSSGFRQTGEGRAISVSTFINYAGKLKTNLTEFLQHIRQLAKKKVGQAEGEYDLLSLSTIHQAKGLEWPVVIIPQCNQGMLPFVSDRPIDKKVAQALLAEERRLFYVALTRSKRDCYLHLIKGEKRSQFLAEARHYDVLATLPKLQTLLNTPPDQWKAEAIHQFVTAVDAYQLNRYFEAWWQSPNQQKEAIIQRVVTFLKAIFHQNLQQQLNITQAMLDFWQSLTQSQTPSEEFPGLEKLLLTQKSAQRRRSPIPNPQSQLSSSIPAEPDLIMPGMWVLSDAGWGQIEQILDIVKRPLPSIEKSNTYARLLVKLRPHKENEPIEIDISAKQINFQKNKTFYQCTRCQQFVSPKMELVIDWHNAQAHDDLSPGFKPVKGTAVNLTTLRYAANYEPRLHVG